MDEVIRTLGGSDLSKLLRYVRDWNTNAKTSAIAQGVLFAVVKLRTAEDIMQAFGDEVREGAFARGEFGEADMGKDAGGTALKELMDALTSYTERHLTRMDKLVQESYMVDYVLSEMDDGMFDGEDDDEEGDGMDID